MHSYFSSVKIAIPCTGLLTVKKIGNQKHYQANRQAPIYEELRGIVLKTFGIGDLLRLITAVPQRIQGKTVLIISHRPACLKLGVMVFTQRFAGNRCFTP